MKLEVAPGELKEDPTVAMADSAGGGGRSCLVPGEIRGVSLASEGEEREEIRYQTAFSDR